MNRTDELIALLKMNGFLTIKNEAIGVVFEEHLILWEIDYDARHHNRLELKIRAKGDLVNILEIIWAMVKQFYAEYMPDMLWTKES